MIAEERSPVDRRLELLARSLLVKRQRGLLDEIGARVGTRVVYLKAAWADPVLYGGRGDRWGSDIDILVSSDAYDAFARELLALGFRKHASLKLHATRAETFRGRDGHLDVDLHRGLAQPPWFQLDDASMFDRARTYESTDGPLVGLSPTDQIVHLVSHCANSRFMLDDRHLNDGMRVLERFAVDWDAIVEACTTGSLEVALHLVCTLLRNRGVAVPLLAETFTSKVRRLALAPFFDANGARVFPTSSATANDRADLLLFLPLLSTRRLALPRLVLAVTAARLKGRY